MSDPVMPAFSGKVAAPYPRSAKAPEAEKNLERSCREFESLFIHHLLKEMRKNVPKDGLFSGGQAEQVYSEMLDGEMAREISNRGGIGLAPVLYNQMAGLLNEKE